MIKRILLAFVLIMCFSSAAYADIIIEPYNDFYELHRNECTYINRSYYINSKKGYLQITKEPGSKNEVTAFKNGELVHVLFTYDYKGKQWGVIQVYEVGKRSSEWANGWLPMDELVVEYDYISFEEDHKDEFYTYTGSYENLQTSKKLVLWGWPGSGKMHVVNDLDIFDGFSFSHAYKDSEQREWGFIPYFYGNKNIWFCVSDPQNEDIPAFNPPPAVELYPENDIPSNKAMPTIMVISVLVIALVLCTVVLIAVFWKKKNDD